MFKLHIPKRPGWPQNKKNRAVASQVHEAFEDDALRFIEGFQERRDGILQRSNVSTKSNLPWIFWV